MNEYSPWNLQTAEEGRTKREYDTACRKVEQCVNRRDAAAKEDLAFAEKRKDRAFTEMLSTFSKRK